MKGLSKWSSLEEVDRNEEIITKRPFRRRFVMVQLLQITQ